MYGRRLWGLGREFSELPPATLALMALLGVTYIAQILLRSGHADPLVLSVGNFHFWQPLTSMFASTSRFNLFMDLLLLWFVGAYAADALGPSRFASLYVSSGLAASLLHLELGIASHGVPNVVLGASGAVMGLLGFFFFRFARVDLNVEKNLGFWIIHGGAAALTFLFLDVASGGYDLLYTTASGGAATFGNFAGFLAGALWGWRFGTSATVLKEDGRKEVERLVASGTLDLAAEKAMEEADQFPDSVDLQELAAERCATSDRRQGDCPEYWIRALRLRLARHQDDEALYCVERLHTDAHGEVSVPADLLSTLAEIKARRGEYAEAVALLRQALEGKAPDDTKADAALRAGQIALHNLSDAALAEGYFRYVVQGFDGSPQAMDAHDELLRMGLR